MPADLHWTKSKTSSSSWWEIIPEGNLDPQKGIKNTSNGKCLGKYIQLFFPLNFFKIHAVILKRNYNSVDADVIHVTTTV